MAAVRVDEKGRLLLPKAVRDALDVHPGDAIFYELEGNVVHLMKGENPFDGLARHAEAEFRAGRTRSLKDWASSNGVALDDE